MYQVIIIAAFLLLLFLIWASAYIGSNVYVRTHCRGDIGDKLVALTFDDGPDEVMTPRVLDILREYDVKAAFFLIGEKAGRHPDLVRRIADEGHIVGNHTFSHSAAFPLSNGSEVRRELKECAMILKAASGRSPLLFRPPFGVTNPIIGKTVSDAEYKTIGWSIRSLDTIGWRSRKDVCRRIVRRLHPGALILCHDSCPKADELLKMLVNEVRSHGYGFASIEDILNVDAYEI